MTSAPRLAALLLTAMLGLTGVSPGHASCHEDPGFRPAGRPVLAAGQTLGDGLTCLLYGRKLVVADGTSRRVKAIVGAFERDGRRVRFETLRGGRTPSAARAGDPAAPRYEIDVRFLSAEGEALLSQSGGCSPIDPTWEADEPDADVEAPPAVGPDARRADFALVAAAIEALRARAFQRALEPEYQALVGQAGAAGEGTSTLALPPPSAVVVEDEPTGGAVGPSSHTGATYRHVIKIFADYVFPIFPAATHGATLAYRIYPSGHLEQAWYRCNHGRCPWQMTGPFVDTCAFVSAPNRARHVHKQSCRTAYNPFSYTGTHNCNDDAATQYRGVRYNYHPDGLTGTCSDPFRHDYTDWCY